MFCTLGNIEFELHTSATTESDTLEITYAEHALINQPGQLQPTGRALVEKQIEIFLHAEFCKVEERLKALTDAALNYDIMALVYGNGTYEADYVITSMGKQTQKRDDKGNLIAVTVSLTLKEYVADKLQNEQKKADKKAFATGKKKGVTGKAAAGTTSNAPCKTQVSTYCGRLRSYNTKENSDYGMYARSTDISVKQTSLFAAKASVSAVKNLSESIKSLHSNCLQQYNLTQDVDRLITICNDYLNAQDHNTRSLQHQLFSTFIGRIVNNSTAANTQSITRR